MSTWDRAAIDRLAASFSGSDPVAGIPADIWERVAWNKQEGRPYFRS